MIFEKPHSAPRGWRSVVAAFALTLLLPFAASASPWGFLVSADGKTRLPLDKPQVLVGSAAKSGAVIAHRTVSKKHLILRYAKGIASVKGLRTKFGTLVAGTLLRPGRTMQLFKRTHLTLGAVTWTFEWGDRGKLIPPQGRSKAPPKTKTKKNAKVTKAKKSVPRARVKAKRPPAAKSK